MKKIIFGLLVSLALVGAWHAMPLHAEGETVTLTMEIKDQKTGQYVFNTEVIKDLEKFAKKHNLRAEVNIKFPSMVVGGQHMKLDKRPGSWPKPKESK